MSCTQAKNKVLNYTCFIQSSVLAFSRSHILLRARASAIGCLVLSCGLLAAGEPRWRNTGDVFPDVLTQIRAMVVRKGEVYVGTVGNVAGSAQVWKLTKQGWVKQFTFRQMKVAVLQTDAKGRLFVGMGTPHSAEARGFGEAEFRVYDANDKLVYKKGFDDKDVIYSMAWYNDKLHIGTMAEDIPGSAEIWRFDEPGWTLIAGDGIDGWPKNNTYAAVYEMYVHEGDLYCGTFSRTVGDGDVLKLTSRGWVDLNAPPAVIALAFITYDGKLTTALSKYKADFDNPVHTLENDGTWRPLGMEPAEWEGAYIPNHLVIFGGELYLGLGGELGTLSVWKFDGSTWTKVAGDGRYGSWRAPLTHSDAEEKEWVYRMLIHQDKLYVGLASTRSPLARVWEMTHK